MKGGNTNSNTFDVDGFDYDKVENYGTVDMKGGKKGKGRGKKTSPKFDEFDFEKEWKEFEESYNQKYGGASKKTSAKKPAKKASSAKKPAKKASAKKASAKKASSAKKPKRKTQKGGDEAGATFAPAQFFDEKATMSAPPTGPFQSAYGTIKAVDGLDRNLAPYPYSSGQQTGGAKKKKDSKKPKPATKTTKPKKDDKKKDSKKDTKKTGKKESVLEKIKKFFAM
jgi:hypothetical protein